jgi:hypothetical protein
MRVQVGLYSTLLYSIRPPFLLPFHGLLPAQH